MSTVSTAAGELSGIRVAAADAAPRGRVDSVDLLRGLVMVIMLLDHTRDFVHADSLLFDPSDLSRTTPALFLTRWITHFCAPVFVLLAGTGAYLQLARGKTKAELSRFLWTRGLWLIVLELTVVRFGVAFNLDYAAFPGFLQVIWVIGVSMIVLAALVHLRLRTVAAIGVAMIALHNLADGVIMDVPNEPAWLVSVWMILHQQGFIPGTRMLVLYPLVPWIGVMAAGYALGAVYEWEPERRRRFLLRLGLGLTAAFVVLRAVNVYGDPSRWAVQESPAFTVLSFLRTTKYPPSLLFLLMTLGPAMLLLAWAEATRRGPLGRALVTFGRVPLFFYVLQWLTAHGLAILLGLAAGQPVAYQLMDPISKIGRVPPGAGFSLAVTYAAWIGGTLLLYPLCRWFAEVKRRRRDWWLGYL